MTLLMAPLLVHHGCRSSWRVALLRQAALSSKVAHLPTVEAWKVAGRKLLWWPDGSLLRRWGRSTVELLLLLLLWLLLLELSQLELWVMALILPLLLSTQLTPRWGIHHAVLWRSTARTTATSGFWHHALPLFLIGLNNDLHHPLLVNDCTCQLVVRQAREMHYALLQVDGEPYTVQVGLLFICVNMVGAILRQGVELPCVVKYTAVPLLKVQELLQLAAEQTHR
jgi:hypothetical protein